VAVRWLVHRLRPERSNHVWAYDFVEDRTHDGRKYRMLCVLDEFTRECLAIRVARRLSSIDVIEMLAELCLEHGVPDHVRSDLGPEFIAMAVREWIAAVGAKTAFIERRVPGRTAMSRASMASYVTNCSTPRSSTPLPRLGSSSKRGDATTIRFGHIQHCLPPAGTARPAVAAGARLVTARAAGHCTPGTEHALTLTLQLDPFSGAGHS
jgi:transposase InsO family protein